jgi:hypothetical protein
MLSEVVENLHKTKTPSLGNNLTYGYEEYLKSWKRGID